jgi:hypothetical protein
MNYEIPPQRLTYTILHGGIWTLKSGVPPTGTMARRYQYYYSTDKCIKLWYRPLL